MDKPDFVRMARDMADEVTKRPGDGIAALAIMSETLRLVHNNAIGRAVEIVESGLGRTVTSIASSIRSEAVGRD